MDSKDRSSSIKDMERLHELEGVHLDDSTIDGTVATGTSNPRDIRGFSVSYRIPSNCEVSSMLTHLVVFGSCINIIEHVYILIRRNDPS